MTAASIPGAAATPTAGFVAKLTAPDGTRHYINICSHPIIERPLDGSDHEVGEEHMKIRGLENLRVPLATGTARTVALNGGVEEAVCFDVVFSPAVLAVALPEGEPEEAADDEVSSGRHTLTQDPMVTRGVRIRLVELALKNAEEDLGYKLGRQYTLPRGVSYKGGVGGGRQPVPINMLRQLIAAKEAEEKHKQGAFASGPWRSKKEAAGLSTRGKIEELASMDDDAKAKAPLLKKGFLSAQGAKGKHIYPEGGSDEGMLFNASNSGDPLGYIPKGLRNRVNVVDTAKHTPEQQRKMMEDYADNKRQPSAAAAAAAAGGAGAGGAKPSGATVNSAKAMGGGGVQKGFLNGAGGSLYPEGSTEGAVPNELDALRELIPSKSELDKVAAETDPNEFLKELASFGSMFGLNDATPAGAAPPRPPPPAPPPAEPSPRSYSQSGYEAAETGSRGGKFETPSYELLEAEDGSVLTLRVKLPELESLGETEVDISADRFSLTAPGTYSLDIGWPRSVVEGEAKAKFLRKSRTLQVTAPLAA